MNLKKLKDTLNKIEDDKTLEKFYITDMMRGMEDPRAEIGIAFFDDEEEHSKLYDFLDEEGMKELKPMVNKLWQLSKEVVACSLNDESFESMTEREPDCE